MMKKILSLFIFLFLSSFVLGQTSTLVKVGFDGKLVYTPDSKGNVIPDYSAVGYKSGDVAIPNVAVVKTISAVSGDNTSNIQNAINSMAALPLDANGIRGALLLKAGTYNINNTVNIKSSGIIIRGEGNSTILMATKTSQYNLISISGSGSASAVSSTSKKIQGSYIPVGAKTFTLLAGHGFVAGDDVMLQRKPNQAWIHMLGMDVLSQIPCDDGGCNTDWTPSEYTINYLRKVVAVNGNTITLDAPNVDVIDSKYAEGFIMKYTWSGKIEKVGVEKLYIDSKYTNVNDESHGWNAVSFSNAKNCWVNTIEVHHFGYSAVTVNESAAFVSVLNSKNIDPISQTIGGRKYSFNINGQRNLVKNCATIGGRHDYVTGAQTAGPNVFVSSTAANQQADIGPHHRWGTGILFDVLTSNSLMDAQNRLGYGTGHGWSGAQIMFWNCKTAKFIVQSPPNHMNWAIGCIGNVTDVGDQYTGSPCISQSTGTHIAAIASLYEHQLSDRLNPLPLCQAASASADDGNVAMNVLDGDLNTRWSASGDGQYIQFCLDAEKNIDGVQIAFYKGNERVSNFDVLVSLDGSTWTTAATGLKSSGTSLAMETFSFASRNAKYVRILGHGNNINVWNSFTEVKISTEVVATNQAPSVSVTSPSHNVAFTAGSVIDIMADAADADGSVAKVEFFIDGNKISEDLTSPYSAAWTSVAGTHSLTAKAFDDKGASTVSNAISIIVNNPPPVCLPASASADDGNVASNVLDGNLATRWSASGDGQWIQFCLEAQQTVSGVQIAFYKGNERVSNFDVLFSLDGSSWTTAMAGLKSSGASLALESFSFASGNTKYVRILGHGNNLNAWNSFTEVKISTGVVAPNNAPSVSIVSPANNASFNVPANIAITANATDSDGSITKVEFFYGTTKIGEDVASPYSITWTGAATGTYSLTVKATDNLGAVTTSSPVTIVIKASTNTCSGIPAYIENGGYVAGSKVQSAGSQYQCKPYPYSGWCNGAAWAYAPGAGSYWQDAWTLLGTCTTGRSAANTFSDADLVTSAPNPFGNSTTITVTVETAGETSVIVYDNLGREVAMLANGYLSADTYSFSLDGAKLKSGMYVCRFVNNGEVTMSSIIKQ